MVATVDHKLKLTLEHLLEMSGGYVLNFTNATFADFVRDSIGIDPYSLCNESKARVLRHLWSVLSDADFAKLTIDMLEHRLLMQELGQYAGAWNEQQAETDRRLSEQIVEQLRKGLESQNRLTPEEAAFLAKDFSSLDLASIDVSIDFQSVIADRLQEIEICFDNEAPLAVVILCGSTLEGLLYEVAKNHPAAFNQATSAPQRAGKVLRLHEWSLNNLIVSASELSVLGEDVVKFASAVREFRNYIHPQQQVTEQFRPRRVTAQIARHVLRAAIEDLAARSRGNQSATQ